MRGTSTLLIFWILHIFIRYSYTGHSLVKLPSSTQYYYIVYSIISYIVILYYIYIVLTYVLVLYIIIGYIWLYYILSYCVILSYFIISYIIISHIILYIWLWHILCIVQNSRRKIVQKCQARLLQLATSSKQKGHNSNAGRVDMNYGATRQSNGKDGFSLPSQLFNRRARMLIYCAFAKFPLTGFPTCSPQKVDLILAASTPICSSS